MGRSPLLVAATRGLDSVVAVLTSRGAQLPPSLEVAVALLAAVSVGDAAAVDCLLAAGAAPDAAAANRADRRTPLHLAAAAGHTGIAQRLLAVGASVGAVDVCGATPLAEATRAGHAACAALLRGGSAADPPAPPTPPTASHATPPPAPADSLHPTPADGGGGGSAGDDLAAQLCRAAAADDVAAVAALLAKGVGIDAPAGSNGRTALHSAAAAGAANACRLLLRRDARVNVVDRDGGTPLRDAVRGGHPVVESLLREHGGLLVWGPDDTALLCRAAAAGDMDAMRRLADHGLDCGAADADGRTALFHAAAAGSMKAVAFLLERGGMPMQPDLRGATALGEAQRLGHGDAVRALLAAATPAGRRGRPAELEGPLRRREASLLRQWVRYQYVCVSGFLYQHKGVSERASAVLDLRGGRVEELGPAQLQVCDRGEKAVWTLQAASAEEALWWVQGLSAATRLPQPGAAAVLAPPPPPTPATPGRPAIVTPNAPPPPAADADPGAPRVMPTCPEDFTALQTVGRGAFGKVKRVRLNATGQVYALKIVNKSKVESHGLQAALAAERELLLSMRHPYIVRLYTSFQTATRIYFVLSFLPGGDLFSHLRAVIVFPFHRARMYAAEILLALECLHAHNVIFRDLKAMNVVLDADGHAVLTDFGLAKSVGGLLSTVTFCGTPEYLAPEMIRREPYTTQVDVWCLGVLLYQMLVGRDPFRTSAASDDLTALILNRDPVFPATLSTHAISFCRQLLLKDPARRLTIAQAKAHPFFSGIDWDRLARREIPAPAIPPPAAHLVISDMTAPAPATHSDSD